MSIGISEIDDQHRELFKRANHILSVISSGKDCENVARLTAFFQNYLSVHYQTEEKYMIRYSDPQYTEHKTQHTLYLAEFSRVKEHLILDSDASVRLVQKTIVDWLANHIKQFDKPMGRFINSAKQKKAA
jgi:hemerythrin